MARPPSANSILNNYKKKNKSYLNNSNVAYAPSVPIATDMHLPNYSGLKDFAKNAGNGEEEFYLRLDQNSGTYAYIGNYDTGNTANSGLLLDAGGGDPILRMAVNAGTSATYWTLGLDNTDDHFKISQSAILGGSNNYFTISDDGKVGINEVDPQEELHITNNQSGTTAIGVYNTDAGASSNSMLLLDGGGGDSVVRYGINTDGVGGGTYWTTGLDNTDDSWHLSRHEVIGGNDALVVDSDAKLGINCSPQEELHLQNNQAGTTAAMVQNTDGGASSNSMLLLDSGGGDAVIRFGIDTDGAGAGTYWTMGMDNTDDAWKVSRYSVIGGNDTITVSSTECVINDDANDYDFRVEGDTDTNLLFCDASTERVGIGTNTPAEKLEVNGTIKATDINTSSSFTVSGAGAFNGGVVFNEDGADVDFRIEGDTEQNLFFVDASTDRIGIGTNTPGEEVHIQKDQDATTALYIGNQNTNTASSSMLLLDAGAGDPVIRYAINSGATPTYWTSGIDNTDDDFKISKSSILGGSNNYFIIDESTGDVTLTGDINAVQFRVNGTGNHGILDDGSNNLLLAYDSNNYLSIRDTNFYWRQNGNWTFQFQANNFSPYTDSTMSCGVSAKRWTNVYSDALDVDGAAIFNESGAAVDFRVEGDTETHLLFADGSEDRVGIGTAAPEETLHVSGNARVSGELQGCRMLLQFSRELSTTLNDAGRTLKVGEVQCNGSTPIGCVMPRPGSITGWSLYYEIEGTPTGDLRVEIYKNTASVWNTNLTSTNGDHYEYDTQARGTDTFAAGDVINMVVREYDGGDVFIDALVGTIEVVFDT